MRMSEPSTRRRSIADETMMMVVSQEQLDYDNPEDRDTEELI
jgi:hypothetical protein